MSGEVLCPIANISRKGRIRRATAGVVVLVATVAGIALFEDRIPGPLPWTRLGAVPFLFFAALCLFQATAST